MKDVTHRTITVPFYSSPRLCSLPLPAKDGLRLFCSSGLQHSTNGRRGCPISATVRFTPSLLLLLLLCTLLHQACIPTTAAAYFACCLLLLMQKTGCNAALHKRLGSRVNYCRLCHVRPQKCTRNHSVILGEISIYTGAWRAKAEKNDSEKKKGGERTQ